MQAVTRTDSRPLAYLHGQASRIPALQPLLHLVSNPEVLRFLRFGLVGVSGILVNTAVLYLLVEAGHAHHLIAAAAGSEVSILSNFMLNERWTFRDARPSSSRLRRAVQYNAVALGGMILSLGVLALLMATVDLHYVLANLIAIGTATVSNYAINSRFTWSTSMVRKSLPATAPLLAE